MVQPLRIDHHGWQLAFLAIGLAGLADPDRRRGGINDRAGQRGIAGDRAGDDDLSGADGRGARAVLGRRPRRARAIVRLCGQPDGGHRGGLPAVRILRQSRRSVRRAVAGVAGRRAGRRGADGRAGNGAGRALDDASCAGGRSRGRGGGLPRVRGAALPDAARGHSVPKRPNCGSTMCARRGPSTVTASEIMALGLALPTAGLIGYGLLLWRARGRSRPAPPRHRRRGSRRRSRCCSCSGRRAPAPRRS